MNFKDAMGLGGLLGCGNFYPLPTFSNVQAQSMQYAQSIQRDDLLICPHQNCPICEKNTKELLAWHKKVEEQKIQKKLDYENRCKVYMERFRNVKKTDNYANKAKENNSSGGF